MHTKIQVALKGHYVVVIKNLSSGGLGLYSICLRETLCDIYTLLSGIALCQFFANSYIM